MATHSSILAWKVPWIDPSMDDVTCWPSWESRAEKAPNLALQRSSLAPRRKMFKDLFGNSKKSSSLRAIMRLSIDKRSMTAGELCAICSRDGQQNECGLQGSEDLA